MPAKIETVSFQERLQQLKEFNTTLVYGFEPEASPQYQLGSTKWEDHLYPAIGQYEDMLSGYLYAQNELIPAFTNIETLNETIFINHIKQLHGHIGKTLLGLVKVKSGEFAEQQIMRWNPSNVTEKLTYFILSNMKHESLQGRNPMNLLSELLTTELKLTTAEVNQYIALILRIKHDDTIQQRESQKKYTLSDHNLIAIDKLCVAFLTNKLTEKEKNLLSKIVTICRDPADLPEAMNKFAKNTLTKWKQTNQADVKAVAKFLAEMFYELTDIHPFGNANGRTATCVMNVFLRSIGLPSILMRNPGDKSISSSSYSLAISSINQTREPLANHIYHRILEAQKETFVNATLAKTINLRCKLAYQLKSIQSKYPQIDINDYQTLMLRISEQPQCQKLTNIEDKQIFILIKLSESIGNEEKRLDDAATKQIKTQSTQFAGKLTLTPTEITQLKQNLAIITKVDNWKINPKDHLMGWIEIPEQCKAEEIAKILQDSKIGDVNLTKRKDNQIPVLQCYNIKLKILNDQVNAVSEQCVQNSLTNH